jgi:RNA polymerase sigma factor (sigma-70 family)
VSVDVGADFAEFYKQARDPCLRALVAGGVDAGRAEDVLAEAFARAYSRWRHVSQHPAPRAWVMRTALNASTSGWRRTRREILSDRLPDVAVVAEEPIGARDPALVAELARLSRRQRQVLALRILLGLDTAETAEVLGIKPNTVGVHLHRALTTLRERLIAAPHEESTL